MSASVQLLLAAPADALSLANDADPSAHAKEVAAAQRIALQFPKWTDGRAYSQAWLLRHRLGFQGELLAVGDVVVDMLPLLQRTGFSAAVLRADQSASTAQRVQQAFTAHYQADANEPRPWFARSASASGGLARHG
jgi:uncharacterized protein (DUF934 family)